MKEFLSAHKSQDERISHTRIGSKELNVFGGKYFVSDEETDEFHALYVRHVFELKNVEHLTEYQRESGPLVIDIDFRCKAETRCYTFKNIETLINVVAEEIYDMFDTQEPFQIYLFQKAKPYTVAGVIKDGIHFYVGLNMDRIAKLMLHRRILAKLGTIWETLKEGLTNSWESILDKNVMIGTTAWQLYGSCKPGCAAYALTHLFHMAPDDIVVEDACNFNVKKNFSKVSVRYLNYATPSVAASLAEEYSDLKSGKEKKVCRIRSLNADVGCYGDIKDEAGLDAALERMLAQTELIDYKINELHAYVMILPEPYYGANSYEKWIRVGWALRNADFRLFLSWIKMSAKSPAFDYESIPTLFQQWASWTKDNQAMLTERSLYYWAKNDAAADFETVKASAIDHQVEEMLQMMHPTEYDFAKLLYSVYKEHYACVSIKHKVWYEYEKQRWNETDSGTNLRNKLSSLQGIHGIFTAKLREAADAVCQCADQEKTKVLQARCFKMTVLMTQLRQTDKKNNIMREACELFYVKDFYNLLDSKNHLLCCTNGVVDFKNKQTRFRQGIPEDYTSKCTNVVYEPLKSSDAETVKEINTFMAQLFPNEDLREYMWQHLASTLYGKNHNQTFTIYNGQGRNGKSCLVDFMSQVLGEYKATVPVTLVTQKRTTIGSTSSEVVQLRGVRYAVMQEPSKGDAINEGVMKELTGGDPLQARALFKDSVTFMPQFKLAVCTNTLFTIRSNDDGTWRRIRVVEFVSKFTEEPKEGKNEFKVNLKIDENFERWKGVFLSMLVDIAFQTNGEVKDCAMVMAASKKYRKSEDSLEEFVQGMVEKKDDCFIRQADLLESFDAWFSRNGNKQHKPTSKELTNYMDRTYGEKEELKKGIMIWKGLSLVQLDADL